MSMKVIHLVTRLDSVGGAQIHVLELARNWQLIGVAIEVWGGQEPAPQFLGKQYPVRVVKWLVRNIHLGKDTLAALELARMLARNRPDVLMLHSSKAGVLGRIVAAWLRIPCVFTAHGWAFSEGMPTMFRLLSWCFEYAIGLWPHHTITVSNYDRNLGLRLGVGQTATTTTVHNGVDDVAKTLIAKPGTSRQIVMVARHCPQKDHASLLHAVQELDCEVLLIGDGPDVEQTRQLVRTLRLETRVQIMGSRRDVAEILSGAGIMVLATHWEGLPRSIIEGMRAGLPIVATNVGGNGELVVDNENGYLVRHGDVAALQQRILQLLSSSKLRAAMGRRSRELYDRKFRAEMLFEKTLKVVSSVVQYDRSGKVV